MITESTPNKAMVLILMGSNAIIKGHVWLK